MLFSDDGGGFAFSCQDAKISIGASTWSTRLSQLGRMTGRVCILTGALPDLEYISGILGKRPSDIWIVANTSARSDAIRLKQKLPQIRISVHPENNAKVLLVAPQTVWISSSDFGLTNHIESAVGLHSKEVYQRTVDQLFQTVWQNAEEIL